MSTKVMCTGTKYERRVERTLERVLYKCTTCSRVFRTKRPHPVPGRNTASHDNTMGSLWEFANPRRVRSAPAYTGVSNSGVGQIAPPYIPGFHVVTFVWKTDNGTCYECGLPAAFYLPLAYVKDPATEAPEPVRDHNKRCAVCAANAACDGDTVARIEEER